MAVGEDLEGGGGTAEGHGVCEPTVDEAVARAVAGTGARPTFVPDTPAASFDDAESMLAVVRCIKADLDRFSAEDLATVEQFLAALDAMVDNGEAENSAATMPTPSSRSDRSSRRGGAPQPH